MTIGLTFPIKPADPKDPVETVPWSLLEPHRQRAMLNHFQPLERLAARGGLTLQELACVMSDRAFDSKMTADAAKKIVFAHRPDEAKDVEKS